MKSLKELKMNNIPILVPMKGISKRCPNKNKKLLPYTANFLSKQNLIKNAVVISDCKELLKLATTYNFTPYFEVRDKGQDELKSCFNFIEKQKYDQFILLPVTQPFRDKDLIQNICDLYVEKHDEVDFITSFTEIPNRERFHLDFNDDIPSFRNRDIIRNGDSCTTIPMIDGAIYIIKTSFIRKVGLSENTNKTFWNGRFRCIKNETFFMDIDTINDMDNFELLQYYFQIDKY